MTADRDTDAVELESFFAAARAAPGPSDDLIARVMADAETIRQAEAAASAIPHQPRRSGWVEVLGGWLTVSGLAAACAAGVTFGLVLPSTAAFATDGVFSTLISGQNAAGFAGFDAVGFALDFEVEQ
ncbi:MAG: dihydroorotate dehydrogenase [Pseudomonadota bacterium]